MIELKDVTKEYSKGISALNGINLKIEQGEFVFIVGDSGSGKSTLIKLIMKELEPTSGTIVVNGHNLGRMRHRKVGKSHSGLRPKDPTRRYTPYNRGPRKVVRPCGERRMHRSGEGCPEQSAGSARLKRKLRPTRRRL